MAKGRNSNLKSDKFEVHIYTWSTEHGRNPRSFSVED